MVICCQPPEILRYAADGHRHSGIQEG
jgi:hypothetical protein